MASRSAFIPSQLLAEKGKFLHSTSSDIMCSRIIIIIIIYYIYIALNTKFLSALQINVLLPRLCPASLIEVHMANKE